MPGFVGTSGGGVENLFLAGDWTDTGWPATMEGAVRSGYAAAGAIVGRDLTMDDVPTGILARLLGLR
jgi:zeta-carotene desaturase